MRPRFSWRGKAAIAFVSIFSGLVLATAGPADAAVCVPANPETPPYCPDGGSVLAVVDSLGEPIANVGDVIDAPIPEYEACWEAFSDPLYDAIDLGATGGISSYSAQGLAGPCGNPGHGGVRVYYKKNYMHSDYFHSGGFGHKLSNWMHLYRANGCNSSFCTMKTYLTNHRNLVIDADTATGWGTFVGKDFSRVAARTYCGWINSNNLRGTEGLKPLFNCYYTFG
jgi:hypothetical protein